MARSSNNRAVSATDRGSVSGIRELSPNAAPRTPTYHHVPDALVASGATERGRSRDANDDHFLLGSLRGTLFVEQSSFAQDDIQCGDAVGHVLVVADGPRRQDASDGGASSPLVLSTIEDVLLGSATLLLNDAFVAEELMAALCRADAILAARREELGEATAEGSPVTLAYVVDDWLYLAHVGHTRCYLMRNGRLEQLTRDVGDTAVGGAPGGLTVELHKLELVANDVVLLCTDGLPTALGDGRIAEILEEPGGPDATCRALLSAARESGGPDNVTVVVAQFGGSGTAAAPKGRLRAGRAGTR